MLMNPANLVRVNTCINSAIAYNRRKEQLVIALTLSAFCVALWAFVTNKPVAGGCITVMFGLSIHTLKEMWRRQVALQIIPTICAGLDKQAAETEYAKLLESLRSWLVFAGIAILLGVAALTQLYHPVVTYTTRIGEHRTIVLPDGVKVTLNTNTRLRQTRGLLQSKVELMAGEAFFDVIPKASRAFRVSVGSTEVLDIGTRFDVYRKPDGNVVVTVLDGSVSVSGLKQPGVAGPHSERLGAKQQIEYDNGGQIKVDTHAVADSTAALMWRQGLLSTGEPLAEIVFQLNRYSTKKIVIGDPRLARLGLSVGGFLSLSDIPNLLTRLSQLGPVSVTETDDAYVLTKRWTEPSEPRVTPNVWRVDQITIHDLVTQLNRSALKKILIEDSGQLFSNSAVSGSFDRANVRDALVELLRVDSRIRIRETDDAFILTYRPPPRVSSGAQ